MHLREEQLHKLLVPTAQKVLKWYQEHKNKLNLTKNVDVSDKGLESLIKLFTDERKIREDVVSSCNEEMPKNAPKLSTESSGINKASSTITNVRKDTDSNTHKKKLLTKKRTEQKEN